jgi:hypothetical protein
MGAIVTAINPVFLVSESENFVTIRACTFAPNLLEVRKQRKVEKGLCGTNFYLESRHSVGKAVLDSGFPDCPLENRSQKNINISLNFFGPF